MAALADGSIVLAGHTNGEITGTIPNAGGVDFAVVKLTEAGALEWAWQVIGKTVLYHRLCHGNNTNKKYHVGLVASNLGLQTVVLNYDRGWMHRLS